MPMVRTRRAHGNSHYFEPNELQLRAAARRNDGWRKPKFRDSKLFFLIVLWVVIGCVVGLVLLVTKL